MEMYKLINVSPADWFARPFYSEDICSAFDF